ncbi:hypothetical protein GALMADRAFT_400082 [Galerina marginata CBS 339.88]|uniref:Uncharacterized protein n=1 Tax=Galerina marginata (strain CBS 339.88) TaxID=685588 RepID=A0A067U3N9_GALM3|nr:hypothetical protein GALMADRAFT_400082 [Galerina marginata CBS 339.88]
MLVNDKLALSKHDAILPSHHYATTTHCINVVIVYHQSSTHHHSFAVASNGSKPKPSLRRRNSTRPSRPETRAIKGCSPTSLLPRLDSNPLDLMPTSHIIIPIPSSLLCTPFFWLRDCMHIYPGTLYNSTWARLIHIFLFFFHIFPSSHRHLAISSLFFAPHSSVSFPFFSVDDSSSLSHVYVTSTSACTIDHQPSFYSHHVSLCLPLCNAFSTSCIIPRRTIDTSLSESST